MLYIFNVNFDEFGHMHTLSESTLFTAFLTTQCLTDVRTLEISLTLPSGLPSLPAGLSNGPLYFSEPQFPHMLKDGSKTFSAYMQNRSTHFALSEY